MKQSLGRARTFAMASLGAILVMTAALGFQGGAARAAFPGQEREARLRIGLGIWVANADGSNPIQLTASPGLDRSPRWSPDGTRLAFASGRVGGSKIFVMNADGSGQRQVTFTPARDRTSAWTADGTQIVYDKEFSEIYAINADGSGGERKLADGLLPGTSPYGDKVVFTASAVGLITMNLDGSARARSRAAMRTAAATGRREELTSSSRVRRKRTGTSTASMPTDSASSS